MALINNPKNLDATISLEIVDEQTVHIYATKEAIDHLAECLKQTGDLLIAGSSVRLLFQTTSAGTVFQIAGYHESIKQ